MARTIQSIYDMANAAQRVASAARAITLTNNPDATLAEALEVQLATLLALAGSANGTAVLTNGTPYVLSVTIDATPAANYGVVADITDGVITAVHLDSTP